MKELTNACKECGSRLPNVKRGDLEGQREIIPFACRMLRLCRRCYAERFPEQKAHWPSPRRFHSGRWIDLKPVMSWFRGKPFARESEEEEIKESSELLQEELDE